MQVGGAVGHDQCSGGVQHDDVAIGAGFARQQGCQRRGIILGVAAAQVIERGQRQSGVGGGDSEAADGPVLPLGHLGRACRGQFVQTLTVDGPGAARAETAQDLGQRLQQDRIIDAHDLTVRMGWITKRSQKIENRAETNLGAHRPDVAHGSVIGGGEQEGDAGLIQGAGLLRDGGVQVDAERGQDVRRAGLGADGAVAVLGDLQASACQNEGGGRRDVIGVLAVAAGAAGVDHLVERMIQRQGGVAHGGGEGDDLVHCLAADAQGGDGGGDLGRGRLASQAGGEEGVGFIRRQDTPIHQLAQQRLETIHGVRP
ncbi:hypothetical protein D3C85_716860 [compost metagenome]